MNHAWSDQRILTHLPAARELYAAQKDPNRPFPPPRFLSIWLSEICNLDCTYCYFAETNHDPTRTFMKTEEILPWLREMRAFGAEALEFSGGGEPTVHKDFTTIFDEAGKMGYALGLITHACNPMPLEILAQRAKYVRCGLDAATPETHEKIKRKPGRFNAAVANIKELVRLRDAYNSGTFTVGIKVVLNSLNFHEYQDVVWLAGELGVDYIQVKYEHSSDHPLTSEQLEIAQEFFNVQADLREGDKFKVLGNMYHQEATVKCFMSPIHSVVNARGELLQCCFMYEKSIGTIRQPIREVWGGKLHREVMAETTVADCNKVDCRWNLFNRRMKEIIEDPLQQASFI